MRGEISKGDGNMDDINTLLMRVQTRIERSIVRAQAEILTLKTSEHLQKQRKQIIEACKENNDILLQYHKGTIEPHLSGPLLQEYNKAYYLLKIKKVTSNEQSQYRKAKQTLTDTLREIERLYQEQNKQKKIFTIEDLEQEIAFCEQFLQYFEGNTVDEEMSDFPLLEHIIMNKDFFNERERNLFLSHLLQNNVNRYQQVEEKEKKKALTALRKKEREQKKREKETIPLTHVEQEVLRKIKTICDTSQSNKELIAVSVKELIEQSAMCIVNDATRIHLYESFEQPKYRKLLIEKDCQNLFVTYQEIIDVIKTEETVERTEWMQELNQVLLSMRLVLQQYEQLVYQMNQEKQLSEKENENPQRYHLIYLMTPGGTPYLAKDAKKIPDTYKTDVMQSLEDLKSGKFYSKYGSDRLYIANKKSRGYKEKREEKTKVLYRKLNENFILVVMARLHVDTSNDLSLRVGKKEIKLQIETIQNLMKEGGKKLQAFLKQNEQNENFVKDALKTETEMRYRK